MSPFSPLVLLGAALVSSPALWSALVGRQDPTVGLSRYLIAVALCWGAGSLLTMLVGPPAAPARPSGAKQPASPEQQPEPATE